MHYFISFSWQGESEVGIIIIPIWQVRKLRCRKVKWRAHDYTARKWKGWVCLTPKPMLSPATPWLTLPRSHSTRTWTQASWLLSRSSVYSVTTVSPSHLYRGAARPPRGRWSEGEVGLKRIKNQLPPIHMGTPCWAGLGPRDPKQMVSLQKAQKDKRLEMTVPQVLPFLNHWIAEGLQPSRPNTWCAYFQTLLAICLLEDTLGGTAPSWRQRPLNTRYLLV